MKALTTAIYGKLAGSTLEGYCGTRLYKGRAEEMAIYPYAEFGVITGSPVYSFSERFENPTIQFDLFSSENGTTQIEDMFTALCALYDDCALSPTSETLIHMRRSNYNLISEEHTVSSGVQQVWHYSIDYDILLVRA